MGEGSFNEEEAQDAQDYALRGRADRKPSSANFDSPDRCSMSEPKSEKGSQMEKHAPATPVLSLDADGTVHQSAPLVAEERVVVRYHRARLVGRAQLDSGIYN